MPATVSGGAAPECAAPKVNFPESVGLQSIALASLDQRATVLEARTNAAPRSTLPPASERFRRGPSSRGTTPTGSSTARGSSSRNDGTAKTRVTASSHDEWDDPQEQKADRRSAR